MDKVCYVAVGIALLAYAYALYYRGGLAAEIASDIGNGVLLLAAVLTLARLYARR